MRSDSNPPAAEVLRSDRMRVVSELLTSLQRETNLSPEARRQLVIAIPAMRMLENAVGKLLAEKEAVEGRARRALGTLRPEDLLNLPAEVRAELRMSANDERELKIMSALEGLGGSATLERLLIEMFRIHKEIIPRQTLARRLHALAERGVIFRTPGKRGLYHTTPEAARASAPYLTNPSTPRAGNVD